MISGGGGGDVKAHVKQEAKESSSRYNANYSNIQPM